MSKCIVFTQLNMAEINILQEPESAVSINEDENEGISEVINYYYLLISQI